MPVHSKEIGGKWRIVDPDDSITKNNAGTSVDSDGHTSKDDAIAQVQAINMSMRRDSSVIDDRLIDRLTLRLCSTRS